MRIFLLCILILSTTACETLNSGSVRSTTYRVCQGEYNYNYVKTFVEEYGTLYFNEYAMDGKKLLTVDSGCYNIHHSLTFLPALKHVLGE